MAYRELRSSLQTLSDQSLKVSRNLDNTYYSILEKVSLWRQTIGSLQELAGLTKELHENFEADIQGLAEDIRGQFEGFDNFDAQEEQVTALEARMKAGKEKADALNARLAAAQQRIEARAKAEEELEARKNRTYSHVLKVYLY
jgi:chromosome segregation ATPase